MQLVELMFDFSMQGQFNSVLRPFSNTSSTAKRICTPPFPFSVTFSFSMGEPFYSVGFEWTLPASFVDVFRFQSRTLLYAPVHPVPSPTHQMYRPFYQFVNRLLLHNSAHATAGEDAECAPRTRTRVYSGLVCSTKTCAQACKHSRYEHIFMICTLVTLGSVFFAVAVRAAVVRHSNGLRSRV
jgi:hypothetical protein